MDLTDIFAAGISARPAPRIRLVSDENCPSCGLPGSPKVTDEHGICWWKCLSSYDNCKIGYWVPGTRRRELKLPPAEAAEQNRRITEQVRKQLEDRIWISRDLAAGIEQSTTIHKDEAIPEGWHRTGMKGN
jgi:hypothetical protein